MNNHSYQRYSRSVISFCLDSKLLGTERHLRCDSDGYSWVDDLPADVWHLSGNIKHNSNRCLDTLYRLSNTKLKLLPPERFVKSMKSVDPGLSIYDCPWSKIMPAPVHQAFVRSIIDQVKSTIETLPFQYYERTWVPESVVFGALRSAYIDKELWKNHVALGSGNVYVLESFKPDNFGRARKPLYNRFGTLTGRLTIADGPGILTLRKDFRSIITPKRPGAIMSLDFAALEARVLLYESGMKCDDVDMYDAIARELGYDRKAVKGAVISELYGSSKKLLGETLGIHGLDLENFLIKVRTFFNTGPLLQRVKAQYEADGYIKNRYGRPIHVDDPQDHVLLNYYAQSTGVDVSLLGFSTIVEQLRKSAPNARPLYLLHDALLLDVPEEHIETINSMKSVKVPGYVQKFYLKSDFICEKRV